MTVSAGTQVTDLSTDDHACLTFGEREELLDLTAAFVSGGLAGGLRVVMLCDMADLTSATPIGRPDPRGKQSGGWPGEPSPRGKQNEWPLGELSRRGVPADSALAAGQMILASWQESLLGPGGFSVGHAMAWLRGQLAASRRDGYPGIRVAMDMGWALRPMAGIEGLPELEEKIAAAVSGGRMSVLCGYDRERFDPVTLASVAPLHSRAVTAATYHDDPVLRICRQYVPPGIRLAGELDFLAGEALALALSEAIRIGGDITITMTGLRFIDAASIRMIMEAVGSLPPARTVVLRCRPGIAARFAQFGSAQRPQVRLEVVDDE